MRKKRKIRTLYLITVIMLVFYSCFTTNGEQTEKNIIPEEVSTILPTITYEPKELVKTDNLTEKQFLDEEPVIDDKQISDEDIELIALVTMAEAEGECEEGKRLVIDTIFNRVDSEHFPDTIYDVIYQPKQFSSMWNGRVDRCEVREEICQLVREELKTRTNYDVIFFTAGHYSKYGIPMFQVEHHYFSSYGKG